MLYILLVSLTCLKHVLTESSFLDSRVKKFKRSYKTTDGFADEKN